MTTEHSLTRALARLRRLQILTLAATLAVACIWAAGRWGPLRPPAPATGRGLRPLATQQWAGIGLRRAADRIEFYSQVVSGKLLGFPAADPDSGYQVLADQPAAAIPLDVDLSRQAFGRGLAVVSVAIQCDNNLWAARDQPIRLWLRSDGEGLDGTPQPLFAPFFPLKVDNALASDLKIAQAQFFLPITPKARIEILVDAQALHRRLPAASSGVAPLRLLIGVGPLLVQD